MIDPRDPERVAIVRRAQDRLIELLAREVAKELVRRQAETRAKETVPLNLPNETPDVNET